ncbi:MAG: hypothetical protein ACOX1U_07985 [Saccharofermentanales bacterium]|jgi:hypothetical protein|nr:hypothetical protein [Clostridiaceae bacterium]
MRNYEKKHRRFKNPQAGWQLRRKGGFGLNEVIGIAAGIIIAAVVVIPGLQRFAGNILENLTSWWNNMAASIFSTR